MSAPRLQSVLENKYDIREKVVVEGKFVALTGSTTEAISLVCIGIGLRCFMVAMVNLAGNEVDYDLISLSPLSLLSFSCHDQSKRLKVHSSYKATQIYQLCTSDNHDDVWNNFTSHIRQICVDRSDSVSTDQSLKSMETAKGEPLKSESNSSYTSGVSELYTLHSYVMMLYETQYRWRAQTCSGLQRCNSMPAILPSTYVTETAYKPPFRSGSKPNVSSKINDEWPSENIDSFVNDSKTGYSVTCVKSISCFGNGSSDDLVVLDTGSLDRSNNYMCDVEPDTLEQMYEKNDVDQIAIHGEEMRKASEEMGKASEEMGKASKIIGKASEEMGKASKETGKASKKKKLRCTLVEETVRVLF